MPVIVPPTLTVGAPLAGWAVFGLGGLEAFFHAQNGSTGPTSGTVTSILRLTFDAKMPPPV
jgi:hypothetical protein